MQRYTYEDVNFAEKSGYIRGWEDCKEYVKSIITREIFASKGNLARQYGLQTVLEELD